MTKFLIGQLARYGDCLYATTIARQIKNDYPDSHITWAIASQYKSILDNNPFVDAIWEVSVDSADFYRDGWNRFEAEAIRRKAAGEFDEMVFCQFPDKYWIRFNGTIRSSILSGYKNKITVPVDPVVRLTSVEVDGVMDFATKHRLSAYKQVILFECNPGSNQSFITAGYALEIATAIIGRHPDTCIILTSALQLPSDSKQIINAASLSFRQNAELTKYCTLLIGCSSGITWLATSDWAKKLPSVQLLSREFSLFAGIKYDHEQWDLSTKNVIEITQQNPQHLLSCIEEIFAGNFEKAKIRYDEDLAPSYETFKEVFSKQIIRIRYILAIPSFVWRFHRHNPHLSFFKLCYFTCSIIVSLPFKSKRHL
jgi:hypothetical protein